MRKVLGFRSGTPWKAVIAVLYYLAACAVLWYGMTTPPGVRAGEYDLLILRLSVLVIVAGMLSPAVFLSETPIRCRLPFFRKRTASMTAAGLMVAGIFFTYLFAAVDSLHTEEFGEAYRSYIDSMYESFIEAGSAENNK